MAEERTDGVFSFTTRLMGSPILLKLFEDKKDVAGEVFNLIKHYEDIFTVNRDKSEVMDINHAAGTHPVAVSKPVFDLIKIAKQASTLPGSTFNVAIGPIIKLWKIGFNGKSVPPAQDIKNLLPMTRPEFIVLDEKQQTVFLSNFGMEIDLGGIAKGYIADRVRDFLLHEKKIKDGLINLGGNVYAMGTPLGEWSIGLKRPFAKPEDPDDFIGIIQVTNKSVVTSGVYERYFEQDGKMYHHLINPSTGYPLDNELLSVTVISSESLDGDVWATLLYGYGLKRSYNAIKHRDDIEAIFITRNKEVFFTSRKHYKFTVTDESYTYIDIKDNDSFIASHYN